MITYPYSSPIIMTDTIFQSYGGDLAETTIGQRQIAFVLAEMRVSDDLGTYLLPTIVTGSYAYAPRLVLEVGDVHQIYQVRFIDSLGAVYYTATGSYNYYTRLYDADYGILDIDYIYRHCGCSSSGYPFRLDVTLRAGLYSGSSYRPNVLLALTKFSSIILNELIGYGNEGVGNIGIQEFRNQQYSEVRTKLLNTAYGNSAESQFIHLLLDGIRKYRRVGI